MHSKILNVGNENISSYDIEESPDFYGDYCTEMELENIPDIEQFIRNCIRPLTPYGIEKNMNRSISFYLTINDLLETEISLFHKTEQQIRAYAEDLANGTTNSQFWHIKTELSDRYGALVLNEYEELVPLNDWIDSIVTDPDVANKKDGELKFTIRQIFDWHF